MSETGQALTAFEDFQIRRVYDEQAERLKKEGSQSATYCHRLRLVAE